MMSATHLPIDDFLFEILEVIKNNNQLLLIAEPGAGKTTRVPPALMKIIKKKIIVLEPRRIAARSAAERICEEQKLTLGFEVGYQVRFNNKTCFETQLIFMSEALLWRKIQADPVLKDIGAVIFDEFHERNIYSDVSLGVLHELQALERPDLKLIIMSATLNTDAFRNYWPDCKTINVPGRAFPVEIFYESKPQYIKTDYLFINRVVEKIKSVWLSQNQERSVLVFLPGISEIRRVQDQFDSNFPIFTLHGNLNLEEQKEVLCSTPKGKIILATNVAESSLTINGVDTVIDTGLSRELINDPRKFYPLLKTSRTSKNSAEQRKGRAGRQFAGKCFRLWNKEDENAMPDHGIPDILKIDLIEASLFLLSINITNPCEFSWFDEKPNASIQKALQTLSSWGLLNSNGTLNSKGLRVSQLPLPPRLGCLIDAFSEAGLRILGCQIAALLLEKDPFFNQDLQSWEKLSNDSDLIPRLLELNEKKISGPFILIEKVAINLYLAVTPKSQALPYRKNLIFSTDTINNLLLSIFHDCLCRRRRINELAALTITGQGVELSTKSLVRQNEFFLALQGHSIEGDNHSIVGLASPVKKAKIIELFASEIETKTRIEMQNGKFFKIQQKFFKKLPLEDEQKISCKTEDIPLRESFIAYWTEFKKSNKEITQWILRLNWAKKIFNKIDWKNLEDNDFDSKAIDIALMGETNFQDILNKNWENTLNLLLTNEQYKIIKNEFPVFLISTRGKRIPLEYEYNQVNAELKIQDAFGWKETPRIANGEIAIRLILLGPHSRPLQTTADLASFWQNTYQQLRGGLKAKYPKHPWPEQPWIKIL